MKEQVEFSFGDDSIATAYDAVLVPSLFEPWTAELIQKNQPWNAQTVLDLACGTGVVTKKLAENIGPDGSIIALDMNSQMLSVAKRKCADWSDKIEFIEGTADALPILDNSLDKVVCQQGFQFFPNKKTAAKEIYRVLKPGGKAILSTWSSVSDCELFGVICTTLESMGMLEISQMMRIPFDLLTKNELRESFNHLGFSDIQCSVEEQPLVIKGGVDKALEFVLATPIGPKLIALESEKQSRFKQLFMSNLQDIVQEAGNIGRMVSNVIRAEK